jgi:hypothetical protein
MPVSIMTPEGPRTRVLVKANDDLVSHCKCEQAIAVPGQLDCPWCGCGWLFVCSSCRKAFTFATCAIVNESLEAIARRDWWNRFESVPTAEELAERMEFIEWLYRDTHVGGEYVWFDGNAWETTPNGLKFEGWYAKHDLDFVPQVRALSEWSVREEILDNEDYWRSRRIERDDE